MIRYSISVLDKMRPQGRHMKALRWSSAHTIDFNQCQTIRSKSTNISNTPVNVGDFKLQPSTRKPGKGGYVSLISETLKDMETDEEYKATAQNLKTLGQKRLTLEERKKRRRALDDMNVPAFHTFLEEQGLSLNRNKPSILQLNIGLYCNQACNHCHVESSPKRTESMSMEVAERCIALLDAEESEDVKITTLDLTGGAPEMNPAFRYLVKEGRKRGLEVIDRCNLTVLMEPDQEDLADFLAANGVRVVASLPCYTEQNTNTQRGRGVFERSIDGLLKLNSFGYGTREGAEKGLILDLVYNPGGAFLPPDQQALEQQYKDKLMDDFGIVFNSLFTITNMPIKRFADFLYRRGELAEYMELLVKNFNSSAVDGVMCKDTVSVGWDGKVYDCDFNQQLAIGLGEKLTSLNDTENKHQGREGKGMDVFSIDSLDLRRTKITMDHHCFGCTAGAGSSCQGAVV
jgi:radical SAM/Cys-rich protein